MRRYIALLFAVLCLMLFSNSVQAQDIAYNFKMPVGYPDGANWALHGGWGYMDNESSTGYNYHPGEDLNYTLGNDCGKEIYASANGIVTEAADFGTGWGKIIEIKSTLPDGSNVWLIYAHEAVQYVSAGDQVTQGELIALVGGGTLLVDYPGYTDDVYEYSCHLHLEVRLQDKSAGYWPSGQPLGNLDQVIYTNPTDFITSHSTDTSLPYTAIQDLATVLYWNGRVEQGGVVTTVGLISSETQNIFLDTSLRDPYYVEYWTGGQWGEVALTFDQDNSDQERAYVVRHGFLGYYQAADASEMGPPLGDEMDQTRVSEYTAYDSDCSERYVGWDQADIVKQCIVDYCGSSSTYSSVQRFRYLTLCYNPSVGVVCDPKWEAEHGYMNPACSREAEELTASSVSTSEGNLWVYGSTVYWIHQGQTHGVVSSELFEACGFDWSDPYPVTQEVFNSLPQGDTIHDPVACGAVVDGTLVNQNGTVYEYWSSDASWHGYPSELVFDGCLKDWSSIQEMSSSVFTTITVGSVVNNSFECGVTYPGLLLHWNGLYYQITEEGKKQPFASDGVFSACGYSTSQVWYLPDEDYPVVTTLQDEETLTALECGVVEVGELVEWNGTVYRVMVDGTKRGFTSQDVFNACAYDWDLITYLTYDEYSLVTSLMDGPVINTIADCGHVPGDLLDWNGTVYRITDQIHKRGFTSQDVFTHCGYDWNKIRYVDLNQSWVVTTVTEDSPISSIADCGHVTGDLVAWNGTVYYMDQGTKRGITSVEAFDSCGFDWDEIRYIDLDQSWVVTTVPEGAVITGQGDCP